MIKFTNITHGFGKIMILDGLNFEIDRGECVFIVGKSGCGKTTLFKLLNREYVPSSGEIIFDDNDISKIKKNKLWQYRRKIGLIFQDMKLLPDRTLWENISLALLIRGEKDNVIKEKVSEILKLVGLTGKEHLFPKELSGGEIQRVTIGRALIGNPQVILADEPTADLDQATAWEIIQLLHVINDAGKTVIIATHNFDIVNSLKKRVILLENGKIVKDEIGGKIKI